MKSLIYFTRDLPGLTAELEVAGFRVYEALAISEVFALVEQHPGAHVVIDSTVDDAAANAIAMYYGTLRLTSRSTAADVLSEISFLRSPRAPNIM